MLQAPIFGGFSFNPFALLEDVAFCFFSSATLAGVP